MPTTPEVTPREHTALVDLEPYRHPGGFQSQGFCGAPSPHGEYVWCRRFPGHERRDDRGHAAYVHKISEPEYWPVQREFRDADSCGMGDPACPACGGPYPCPSHDSEWLKP